MKRTLFVTLLLFKLVLVAHAQKEPVTSREFFQEVQNADGIPKWAVNVCFEDDNSTFFLTGGTVSSPLRIQPWVNGIAAHLFSFKKLSNSMYTTPIMYPQKTHGTLHDTWTFRVNWDTGRFQLDMNSGVETKGVCEDITSESD